jgi:hypothetical protein
MDIAERKTGMKKKTRKNHDIQKIRAGCDMQKSKSVYFLDGKIFTYSCSPTIPIPRSFQFRGTMARNAKKGQMIKYNPFENTEDVIVCP